jgi:hypothetical protein
MQPLRWLERLRMQSCSVPDNAVPGRFALGA